MWPRGDEGGLQKEDQVFKCGRVQSNNNKMAWQGGKGLATERDEWCRRYSGFANQNEFARGN